MITLDSPVMTVLGATSKKHDKIRTNLRIETVGDLLRHFPRRYVETGRLTKLSDLEVGQMLTVIGEIVSSKLHTYQTGAPVGRRTASRRRCAPTART